MKMIMKNLVIALCVVLSVSNVTMAQTLSNKGKVVLNGTKQMTVRGFEKVETEKDTMVNSMSSTLDASLTTISSDVASRKDTLSVLNLEFVISPTSELTVEGLQGTWSYATPACKFLSEDLLMSAGGEIIASQVVAKLVPIFTKVGVTPATFSFSFEPEGSFVMNYAILPLSGSVTRAEEAGMFTLEFAKLVTIAIAKTPVHIEVVNDKMIMLFEADKLVNMLRSVVNKLGITSLNTIFDLVDSYDGVLIGFELNKQVAQ